MKKQFGDYYFGIDAGTDSVGWAVTDEAYTLQKINGKAMWGIRLFDAGESAEERRLFRTARRRQGRRVQRTKLLQELFADEVSKIDSEFFIRMNESKFLEDDKKVNSANTLFNDDKFKDKDYHRQYPTIYHLRKAIIEDKNITDVRLLYLAIHHIIRNRGHFLFQGMDIGSVTNFNNVYNELNDCLLNEFDFSFPTYDINSIAETLKKKANITSKKKALEQVLQCDTKQKKSMIALLAGASGVKISDIFDNDEYNDAEINKISFSTSKYDEDYDILSDILQDKIIVLDYLKATYDWAILADILDDEQYISYAKTKVYDTHKAELALLKKVIRKYSPDKYSEVFRSNDKPSNYCAYIGSCKSNGKKAVIENKKCTQDDFCKYIKGILQGANTDDKDVLEILDKADKNILLTKQTSKDNGVIPYQVNLIELTKILENAEKHFEFLKESDENGLTVSEKIIKLFKFKIPYYVGPLNDSHKETGNCWIVKRSNERITPWNFDNIVDVQASSEQFILRMTNKCTYLIGEDVLPKNSLLYSEFMVLNELNNLRLNGEYISIEDKKKIFDELFKGKNTVKMKDIVLFYKKKGISISVNDLSGTDGDFKSSLKSYRDFSRILGNDFNEDYVEEAIKSIVVLGDEKKMLSEKLSYIGDGYFNKEQIKQICRLKYTGWGRLSRKFLTQIFDVDKKTGECGENIINMMRDTSENLMQLLGNKYGYMYCVENYNASMNGIDNGFSYENLVKDLYASPKVKRSIWQILVVMREIEKIMGHAPKKIFVEMAREDGVKQRTKTRKESLLELYKSCKDDTRNWAKEISALSDGELRRDALYLYYIQMGRCMYSGEPIDINELFNKNIYDIDHIYPQSKTKDDSLENRVLVRKDLNAKKTDKYPIPEEVLTEKAKNLWKVLKEKKFIKAEKYNRLTRRNGFSDDELSGFIARQLVETRQSTKAAAELLKKVYPDSKIVYSKASNVDVFKKKYDIVKVREVNDYHHAKDAYLNIVVGNVFDVKFTSSPYNFVKNKEKYSLNDCMYNYDVKRNGYYAWKTDNNETIGKVKSVLNKNNILYTRYAYETKGGLFDQQIMKKHKGQLPIKGNDPRLTIDNYGGYNKISGAYFIIVDHEQKGKKVRTIEYVPVYLSKKIEENASVLDDYVNNTLKLENAKILLRKIKTNTLFKNKGFLMHICGRTGNQLLFQGAIQLCLNSVDYAYAKRIVKFNERCRVSKSELTITPFDQITLKDSIRLYNTLLFKLENTIYKVSLNSQIKTMTAGTDKFESLSLEKQCKVLFELLHLFKCDRSCADLSLIGGASHTGIICLSKNITNNENLCIINQSPTGLFEQVINLNSL